MQKSHYIYLTLFLLMLPLGLCAAGQHNLQAMLHRLDTVIDAAPRYERAKLARIAGLRRRQRATQEPQARYDLGMQLFEEYRSYQNDTAVIILQDNLQLARKMGREDLAGDCLSLIAYQCSNAGSYVDSRSMLDQVDERQLSRQGRFHYYRALFHLNNEIGYYSRIKSVSDSAYKLAARYEALAMNCVDKQSADYREMLCRRLFFQQKRMKEALRVCDEWVKATPEDSREYAIAAYYEYLLRITMHDETEAIYWAARSAISDLTHSVMDQASLWAIADYISGRDIDRSYRYIKYSWRCVSKFGTSVRAAQISPILSVIEAEYKTELDDANHRLMVVAALITVLALVLFFMLYYATRQRRHLALARNDLRQRNDELADINAKLGQSNAMLQQANERISAGNAQLKEADQIKEAYIGRFLTLCSDYINRMEKGRREANRLLKAHRLDELNQMTRSTEQKEKDVEELYGYFDRTFLNLFPTFVDDFNALLKPENRIEAPAGRLTTTLRIFALIRLGIDDSGKIAEFLHYSVNTIYNYRARTKNGCIGNRDTFEEQVKGLGKI